MRRCAHLAALAAASVALAASTVGGLAAVTPPPVPTTGPTTTPAAPAPDPGLQAIFRRRKAQVEQVRALTAGARSALARVLQADRSGTYGRYRTDVAQLRRLRGAALHAAVAGLTSRYLAFFQTAFGRAGIDEAALRARILRILPGARFGPLLTLTWREPDDPAELTGTSNRRRPALAADTQTFTAPYDVHDASSAHGGLGPVNSLTIADRRSGRYATDAFAEVGFSSITATAALGHTVNVPAGLRTLGGAIQTDLAYQVLAAGLLDASAAWTDIAVEVEKPDGTRLRRTHNLAYVLAPVVWVAEADGTDDSFVLGRQVAVPTGGGTFRIRARSTSACYTYGAAGACDGNDDAVLTKLTATRTS